MHANFNRSLVWCAALASLLSACGAEEDATNRRSQPARRDAAGAASEGGHDASGDFRLGADSTESGYVGMPAGYDGLGMAGTSSGPAIAAPGAAAGYCYVLQSIGSEMKCFDGAGNPVDPLTSTGSVPTDAMVIPDVQLFPASPAEVAGGIALGDAAWNYPDMVLRDGSAAGTNVAIGTTIVTTTDTGLAWPSYDANGANGATIDTVPAWPSYDAAIATTDTWSTGPSYDAGYLDQMMLYYASQARLVPVSGQARWRNCGGAMRADGVVNCVEYAVAQGVAVLSGSGGAATAHVENGAFSFEGVRQGTYRLQVSALGGTAAQGFTSGEIEVVVGTDPVTGVNAVLTVLAP